jgi:hypothetical protein
MEFTVGIFEHSQIVIDYAYKLVREYDEYQRALDREVTHLNEWHKMKSKCYNPKGWNYYKYGAIGIRVCRSWITNLDKFIEDMGPVPEGATGLCRKNKQKHFTPENTAWKF